MIAVVVWFTYQIGVLLLGVLLVFWLFSLLGGIAGLVLLRFVRVVG